MVFERSTGTSTSILGAGFGLFWRGLAAGVGCLAGADGLREDFRMLSMEKLRFLVVEAGEPVGLRMSEASRTSVGVLGGEEREEKLEERTEVGGERLKMSVSSVLIW